MKASIARELKKRKLRIEARLRRREMTPQENPVFTASNVEYEVSGRGIGLAVGGIGAVHVMARRLGLFDVIDQRISVLKLHHPYQESDHVLNIAFNVLASSTRLEHLERLRNDEVYLDVLGVERIPDSTTAGDFCRRFVAEEVGVVDTGRRALEGEARDRRTHAATHGVRHIPPRGHARSMPDRQDRETLSIPPPLVESVALSVLSSPRPNRVTAMLTRRM